MISKCSAEGAGKKAHRDFFDKQRHPADPGGVPLLVKKNVYCHREEQSNVAIRISKTSRSSKSSEENGLPQPVCGLVLQ